MDHGRRRDLDGGLFLAGQPDPGRLAAYLADLATEKGARIILLDGPQAWKDPANGLSYQRVCERILNTPAKTGIPGQVKPRTYTPFVAFSICVFDELEALGWVRLRAPEELHGPRAPLALESFPSAAWRALGLRPLPAKSRSTEADLRAWTRALKDHAGIAVPRLPTHDELQALAAGLAGVFIHEQDASRWEAIGRPLLKIDGSWREGFIVIPKAPGTIRAPNKIVILREYFVPQPKLGDRRNSLCPR